MGQCSLIVLWNPEHNTRLPPGRTSAVYLAETRGKIGKETCRLYLGNKEYMLQFPSDCF